MFIVSLPTLWPNIVHKNTHVLSTRYIATNVFLEKKKNISYKRCTIQGELDPRCLSTIYCFGISQNKRSSNDQATLLPTILIKQRRFTTCCINMYGTRRIIDITNIIPVIWHALHIRMGPENMKNLCPI